LLRGFAYVSDALLSGFAPALTAVTPDHGPESIDTADILTGRNFVTGEFVFVGAARGAGVRLLSSSILNSPFPHQPAGAVAVPVASGAIITAVTPAGPKGVADITVKNLDGQSATLAGGWLYVAPPAATAIWPPVGPPGGNTIAVVTGHDFDPGAVATVGGATVETVAGSSGSLAITMPAGTGTADVTIKNPGGQTANPAG